eukprot:3402936-Pleurochrysis_carterae.AAC.2
MKVGRKASTARSRTRRSRAQSRCSRRWSSRSQWRMGCVGRARGRFAQGRDLFCRSCFSLTAPAETGMGTEFKGKNNSIIGKSAPADNRKCTMGTKNPARARCTGCVAREMYGQVSRRMQNDYSGKGGSRSRSPEN